MRRDLPDWGELFVFGSALTSKHPNDLDLLVVYDSLKCPPEQARDRAMMLVSELVTDCHLQPHVVVLKKSEERSVQFIRTERCIDFDSWLKLRAENRVTA